MTEKIYLAGLGGQGVLSLGQMLTYAGMAEGREISWLPSYGAEMRGGPVHCHVILSDEPIGAPVVIQADALLVMNTASLVSFEAMVRPGGIVLVNSSLIARKASREDVKAVYVPANEIAVELGNTRVAGMVMLGAYLGLNPVAAPESVIEALKKVLGERKANLIPVNRAALERGQALVKEG